VVTVVATASTGSADLMAAKAAALKRTPKP
jgi:hypothetical protein